MAKAWTHRELCEIGTEWLRQPHRCPYAATEFVNMSSPHETPDIFGWDYWSTTLIEVKVSRSDFIADAKKTFRINSSDGMGNFRYYLCPEGLIKTDELPQKWGLLYVNDLGQIVVIKCAEEQASNTKNECCIYRSIICREFRPRIFDCKNKI